MSESGLSNDEEAKKEHAQDGRWTREEHYCFLKAVATYGREVSKPNNEAFLLLMHTTALSLRDLKAPHMTTSAGMTPSSQLALAKTPHNITLSNTLTCSGN